MIACLARVGSFCFLSSCGLLLRVSVLSKVGCMHISAFIMVMSFVLQARLYSLFFLSLELLSEVVMDV